VVFEQKAEGVIFCQLPGCADRNLFHDKMSSTEMGIHLVVIAIAT
jgi:hypothetical protein